MKKIIAFISVTLVIALLLTGCAFFGGDTTDATQDGAQDGAVVDDTNAPTLNGEKITKYSIVYSDADLDYSLRAAEYIKSEILARTGFELAIAEDDAEATANEIVVGETSREISKNLDADTTGFEFALLADGGKIALEGDYFVIAAAAYYFVETYIPSSAFDTTVPAEVAVHEPIMAETKSVVLLIGDGMGVYQSKMFDYMDNTYDFGDGEDLFYGYLFPSEGRCVTNSLTGTTDSAAAATALATGYKTENGFVGRDPYGNDLVSITELAASLGKSTAIMSTEASTGATPSGFSAHANNRDNKAEILETQTALTASAGTIFKCNYNLFAKNQLAVIEGYVTDTLTKLEADENGFFLMYEEAHIDKNSHNNEMVDTFRSLIRFNQIIARFMEYAFYNPGTAVLITADHETGDLYPDENGALKYHSEGHTPANVPLFAYGMGTEVFNRAEVDNTQIPKTIAYWWGVTDFGDQTTAGPVIK